MMTFGDYPAKGKEKDYVAFVQKITAAGWHYDDVTGHVVDAAGKQRSYISKNGYYRMYEWAGTKHGDKKANWYLEHRVIWLMLKGEIDCSLVINHIDNDRGNNHIENLELISQKANAIHAAKQGRMDDKKHTKGNPLLSDDQVKAIRYLNKCGWSYGLLGKVFAGTKSANPWHVAYNAVQKTRYGHVPDAGSVWEIYPSLIHATTNKELTDEQLVCNALMGMAGECGEVVDLMKKHLYQGHELDMPKMMEEIGDLLYYTTMLSVVLYGLDATEIMLMNIDKLKARYPEGFSAEQSLHRKEGDI